MFRRFPQLPFWAKVGEIPTSYKVSMSYEEQLLWLCQQIENIKSASGNIDYNALENKPIINGVTLQGTLTLNDLDIQQKLRAGNGIIIDGNIISATGGGSGGTDNYNLLNNKPSINGVILQGDKTFSDFGLQTSKTYEELTDYVDGYYFDIGLLIGAGDNVPSPSQDANSKYMVIDLEEYPQARYRITGRSDSCVWFTCSANPLLDTSIIASKSANDIGYTEDEVEITLREESKYLVFNFTDTNSVTPKVERIIESVGGVSDYTELSNKPSINGVTLVGDKSWEDLGLQLQKSYNALSGYVDNYYFPVNELVFINDFVPSPTSNSNSCYVAVPVSSLQSNSFRITGHSDYSLWFTCSDNPTLNTSLVKSKSATNLGYTREEIVIDIPEGANYIVFNFTDTDVTTPVVEVITESLAGTSVTKLQSNIVLTANTPLTIDTGFYLFESGSMYYHQALEDNLIYSFNDGIFYFDKDLQSIYLDNKMYFYDTLDNDWGIMEHTNITNEILDNRGLIPTSQAVYNSLENKINTSAISSSITSSSTNSEVAGAKAVYDALQNISPSGDDYYEIVDSQIIFESDGTTRSNLETGYYFITTDISYWNGSSYDSTSRFTNKLCYLHIDENNINTYLMVVGENNYIYHTIILEYYNDDSEWNLDTQPWTEFLPKSYVDTSISGSSTNQTVPSSKCVYDEIRNYAKPKDDIVLHLTLSDSSSSYDITPISRLYA